MGARLTDHLNQQQQMKKILINTVNNKPIRMRSIITLSWFSGAQGAYIYTDKYINTRRQKDILIDGK